MYRQNNSGGVIGRVILLGVLVGIGFVIYDLFFSGGDSSPADQPGTIAVLPSSTPPPPGATTVPASAPTTAPPTPQGAVDIGEASLLIPRTGAIAPITQVYLDGTSWDVSNLGMAVGHLQGTSWVTGTPPGNIVLSGHVELSDGRRGIFAGLEDLQPGETIILTRNGIDYFYRVVEINGVEPDDLTPVYPTTTERLTLITCSDYNFFADTYDQRQVVIAERINDAG